MSDETNKVLIDNLTEKVAHQSKRLTDIEEEIWGFPKGKGLGLLQKVRDSNKKWTIVWAICVFLFAILGRVGGNIFDKFVSDWVYNSPSQKWLKEQQRPKVKVYKIRISQNKNEPIQPPQ